MEIDKKMPLTNEQSAKEITPLGVDESRRNTFSTQPKTLHELESIVIEGSSSQSTEESKIVKVPDILQQNEANENCFTPLVIALGPYHRGRQELNREREEELKTQLLREFYKGDKQSLRTHREKVKKVAREARNCYSLDSTKDLQDDEFANMMLHDGCCVLQFISCTVNGNWGQMNIKHHEQELIIRDLFLLENQVPFLVLKQLMPEDTIKINFTRFITKIRSIPQVKTSWAAKMADFFYYYHRRLEQKKPNDEDKEPLHLLGSLWKYYVQKGEYKVAMRPLSFRSTQELKANDWYSFRSTQELKAAGIMFSLAKTSRFTDVMYMPLHLLHISFLCLPPILVDDSTKSLLLNLAAYEMSPGYPDIYPVSSYICLMDSLMDQEGDVAELRRSGILLNRLRSDQEVVKLFKDAAKNLVSDQDAFRHAKMHIEKHYRNKIKIKITKWLFLNIRIMSFIPAIFGLGMTLIQTFVSVHEYARQGKK